MREGSVERRVAPYGWAIGVVVLTHLVRLGLDPTIGPHTPIFVLYFLPVIISAWRGGIRPALVAAILAVALGDRVSMDLDNGVPLVARALRVGTFLVESAIVGWLFEARRREAVARAEADARYRALVDNFPGGCVFMVGRDCRYVLASGLGLVDIGMTTERLVGKTPGDVFEPAEAARIGAIFGSALRGHLESVELELRGHSFLVRAAPIKDDSGAVVGAIAVTQNISARKRLERDLREAQKLEAIGKLAGGVAHDFNNVLGVIGTSLEMLATKGASDSQRKLISMMGDAADRATGLTKQLAEFGRRQVLGPDLVDAVLPTAASERIVSSVRVLPKELQLPATRVLVVDDEDSIRSLTVQFLTARGFVVEEAADAATALAMISDDVAVVITDLYLDGMHGIDLCREIRKTHTNAKFVIVSGSNEVDATTDSLVEIGARFLPKPFHLRDLAAIVESIASTTESQELEAIRDYDARRAVR